MVYISIVYRWGGIETFVSFFFTHLVGISIVYRWGGIETSPLRKPCCSRPFLLSTAEAVLRPEPHLVFKGIVKFLLSTAEAVLRRHKLLMLIVYILYFYCLPLRRYWDINIATAINIIYFYCLPLRRYWDEHSSWRWYFRWRISIVYRWGGIETIGCEVTWVILSDFYCLPLRRYWDKEPLVPSLSNFVISIVYRWGGIETEYDGYCSFYSHISIVYRCGGIETLSPLRFPALGLCHFYCLPLRRYWDR